MSETTNKTTKSAKASTDSSRTRGPQQTSNPTRRARLRVDMITGKPVYAPVPTVGERAGAVVHGVSNVSKTTARATKNFFARTGSATAGAAKAVVRVGRNKDAETVDETVKAAA